MTGFLADALGAGFLTAGFVGAAAAFAFTALANFVKNCLAKDCAAWV